MYDLILIFHIIFSIILVVLVLFQQGKGADAGAAFGSGSTGMVLGTKNARSFLSKLTMFLSIAFFVSSISLAYLASSSITSDSVTQGAIIETEDNITGSQLPNLEQNTNVSEELPKPIDN